MKYACVGISYKTFHLVLLAKHFFDWNHQKARAKIRKVRILLISVNIFLHFFLLSHPHAEIYIISTFFHFFPFCYFVTLWTSCPFSSKYAIFQLLSLYIFKQMQESFESLCEALLCCFTKRLNQNIIQFMSDQIENACIFN